MTPARAALIRTSWAAVEPIADDAARLFYVPLVGSALLWTLEQGLGDAFTDETAHAWADAYRRLSSSMIEAARQEQTRAARPRRRRWRGPAALPLGLATGSVST